MKQVLDALEKFAVLLGYVIILKKIIDFSISLFRGIDTISEPKKENE